MPSSSSWFRTAQPPSTPDAKLLLHARQQLRVSPIWRLGPTTEVLRQKGLRSRVERHVVLRPREPVPLIGKNVIHHILVVLPHRCDDLLALRLVYPRIVGALSD